MARIYSKDRTVGTGELGTRVLEQDTEETEYRMARTR
jgi:hypothetical protein